MAASQEKIWYFEVNDPTNHPKGFTIYKVTAKVFPINAPEKLTEIVIWKRYNDFKQLYKSMTSLHQSLHRRDAFPDFAKPKLFGRFDEQVIEERRSSALNLLNFIGKQSHLYKSQLFTKFLQGGKVLEGLSGKLLKPARLDIVTDSTVPSIISTAPSVGIKPATDNQAVHLATGEINTNSNNGADNTNNSEVVEPTLEGVWNFPIAPEKISLNSYDDDTDVDSALGTPLNDSDISFFDPLTREPSDPETPTLRTSKSWIRVAATTCAELDEDLSNSAVTSDDLPPSQDGGDPEGLQMTVSEDVRDRSVTDSSTITGSVSDATSSTMDLSEFDPLTLSSSSSGSKVVCGRGDVDISQLKAGYTSGSSTSLDSSCSTGPSPRHLPLGQLTRSPGRHRASTSESVSTMDLGSKEDYIHMAAKQICLAQEYESNGKFELAFATYKNCVGILLQGVQGDKNKGRRDAVRRKTAQYLMKAEELYNRHLAKEASDEHRWAIDTTLSPSTEVDPTLTFIRGSASELKNFKVLGTIGKVILVLDKTTDETFVIKAVYKSTTVNRNKPNILPTSCPYMVQLHKFFETQSTIYLLLQYASGGCLWDYIGAYLAYSQGQGRESGPGAGDLGCLAHSPQNVYTGYKIHEDNNKRPSFVAAENDTVKSGDEQVEKHTAVKNEQVSNQVLFSKTSENVQITEKPADPDFVELEKEDFKFSLDAGKSIDVGSIEAKDVKDDVSAKSGDSGETKREYKRYTSFSSVEENAEEEGVEGTPFSPPPLERQNSHGAQFQEVLQKSRTALENFSINSFDSAEGVALGRHDSNMSDQIGIIHEVNEQGCDIETESPQQQTVAMATGDWSGEDLEVFTSNPARDSNSAITDDLSECKESNSNTVMVGSSQVESCDNSEDIVRHSKEILRNIERTLSQIDSEVSVGSESKSQDISDATFTLSSPMSPLDFTTTSGTCDSIEEPSIYDLHRHGDTSDSQSDTRSQENGEIHINGQQTGEEVKTETVVKSVSKMGIQESVTERSDSESSDHRSRSSSDATKVARKPSVIQMNPTTELSRSASLEKEARSPSKMRQRTISHMFEQLDLSATVNPDQVRIPESFIKRWAAEIIVAISKLHSVGIICRELKPENILLGDQGHATLTYFCQINQVADTLDFDAIQSLYVAPEVRNISGYTETCDWWSLGVLLYELLIGKSLLSCHPGGITSHTQLHMPDHLSEEARALLLELLRFNPRERLGSGMDGVEEIKAHPFFSGIDWNAMDM